jgi:hypothetical protein
LIDYSFEIPQPLKFVVLNIEKPKQTNETTTTTNKNENYTIFGETECLLSEIIISKGYFLTKKLIKNKKEENSQINLRCEEVNNFNDVYTLQFSAENLKKNVKKNFIGMKTTEKYSLYFEIAKSEEDGGKNKKIKK